MAKQPARDPFASIATPMDSLPQQKVNNDPFASIATPLKKKDGTELSGEKSLSDGKEDEGFFTSALMMVPRALKGLGEGAWNKIIDEGIGATRELAVNLMPDKFFAPQKMTFDEKLKAFESFAPIIEKQKVAVKGDASIIDEGGLRLPDPEAFGAALGEQLMQLQRNTNPAGMVLNHLSFAESNYQEARQRGIDPTKSYFAGHALALTETLIDKYSGIDKRIDKFVTGKLGKIASDEAIDQIVKLGIKSDAFGEAVDTAGGTIKNLLTKGVLPESISEGIQQVVTTGEKQLFDIYQKATNQVDETDKDKKGQYGADVFSMQTVRDVVNSSFMGGLVGSLGYSFTASGDFNPTIYATLQREYNEKGKDGLGAAIENVKSGITKASESGRLTPEQYNAALQNVDKIANNVSTFEQNSKIDPYTRYKLFDLNERLIPMASNGIAKDLAKMATPIEMPTPQQIDEDLANGNVTTVSFDQLNEVPDSYRNFIATAEDENGNKVIQFEVPNSIVKAHTDNEMAIQTLMNNPLFAIKSLTDNNQVVKVEDLENIGLGGGAVFPSSSQQLQFKTKFEENRAAIINGIKTINYLKSVSNQIKETGKSPDENSLNTALNNIYKFNTGDTVFYNNVAHKILETSPDGQKLKLSGVQEQVNASDENVKTQREAEEVNVEQPTEGQSEPAPVAETPAQEQIVSEEIPQEEVEDFPSKTIGDAVYELTPYVYQGRTGRLQQQSNGLVTFETKDKVYELGNIEDLKDKTLSEWGIVQQEMSTDKNFGVTIDGKTFTNKNQNPFAAITYDENGEATSVKLQDDKGKTKVIKGARAQLIDAQYKERKILNESTDEQLNEVEQQVTARTEDIGNAEQAPTGGQVKPVEPAFTEKQRERQRTINEVAKRLAQQSDNMKSTNEAIANITSSLFTAGINVEVLTSEQIKAKYGSGYNNAQGFFISPKGVIVINKNMVESEWGKTVVFHEATHPIINIIRNTDPKAFKQLVKAIRDMRGDNTTIDSIIKSIEANPDYKGQFTQDDEIVVETIAMIASGKLKLNEVPPSLSQKLKDLINKIGKVLGFRQVLRDNNDVAFVKLANQISDVLNSGRDIAEIVGAGNITNYSKTGLKNDDGTQLFGNNSIDTFKGKTSNYQIDGNVSTVADVQFKVNNSVLNTDNEVESVYLKDNDEFKELTNKGIITNDKTIEDFEGVHMVLHQPDAAFSGEIYKNIKTKNGTTKVLLVEGSGGVFFPIKFHKDGLVWASTKDGLDSFFKSLDDSYKKNNGKVYIGLTTAPSDKMLSSTTMAQGVIDLFNSKVFDKKYTFTDKNLRDAIINGYLYEKEKSGKSLLGSKKDLKISDLKKMSKEELIDFTKERLLPSNSVFPERKNFTVGMLNHIASMASDNKKMSEQLGEFFHISINNELYKGKYNIGYKLSKENLVQSVSHMFAEPMLRLRTKEDADKGGAIYAVIEVSGEIESIDSEHHISYPKAVRAKNGEGNVKLHILQSRYQWSDVMLDNDTNEYPAKDKQASIYPPSSGITFSALKVGKTLKESNDIIRDANDMQFSNIDRNYTMESTLSDAGMTMAEKDKWQEKNKVSQRQERDPIVQKAAEALRDGIITIEGYVDVVRQNMPIYSMPKVPKLPTLKEIVGALNKQALDKGGIVGLNKGFMDGERVASRLDIPAYNTYNTWVVSIHDGEGNKPNGNVLGYGQTAVLKNVQFGTSPKGALNIAIDKGKATIARIYGDWSNEAPESVHKRATELMNDPAWTQVGMNPFRHSFFYDKSDGTAVISADEVVQVGALVLAKNVVKAPIGSEAFKNHFTFVNEVGKEIQFSNMSRDDQRINTLRNEYYNNDVPADVLIEAAKKEYGLDQQAAEMLVSKATGSVLDLAPYETENKTALSDEQIPSEVESILEQYTKGYDKDKKDKLTKESKKTTFSDIAVKLYDSKFKIRRILQSLSDMQTLSSAKLRNIMGKAKASSMEAQQAIAKIYGGLGEKQIRVFDELNFALRVIQLDKNNNEKVYKEYDKLRKQFIKENNGKLPSEKQLEMLMAEARNLVPEINHGLLDERLQYTAKTAQKFIDTLREAYSTEDFDNLMSRAAEYKKVGNESVNKMLKAGIISQEVADKYKDDFYTFRKTLERYYDDYSSNVPIYYKDGVAYYSAFKSLGEGSKDSYFQRDSRVLLAENILIVNKAIAKNDLRKSIFNDIMVSQNDFFDNPESTQRVIKTKEGGDLSFAFKPAVYKRAADGKVKKEASGYVVEPAQEGFVNVPFRVDGSLQYFQMEKELYDEVEGLNTAFNPQESNFIMQMYYGASNAANKVLTASQTRYNPLFFWRNMSMDIRHQVHFTDYWTSDKNFLVSNVYSAYGRLLFKSIANTKKIFANEENMAKLLEEATEVGLFMDTYSEAREQIKRSSEIDTYAILDGKPSKWSRFKSGVAAMNVKTEIAMRVSAYEQAKKFLTEQYKKVNNVTELNEAQLEEIKEIASAQARGYTDFAQKGTLTPQLNYAYLNASIQGLGSAIEYSYDNPAKTLRKTSELFVGHMIWTTMLMMAIPDLYDELDEYTKDIYMLSPTGFAMKKIKDSLGLPSSFIPASKIDPTLVPIMGVARRTAENIVKSMRGEKTEPITYEETARLINIALPSIFALPEKTAPLDAIGDWGSKILSGSSLLSGGTKLFFGYDAFRGRDIDSKNMNGGSNSLDGMYDSQIPYIYKVISKAAALATNEDLKAVSPARINAAAESIVGSPKSSFLTGVLTSVASDIANIIIPASDIEKSEVTTFNPKTVMKSFGVITDSGMKERVQNRKFMDESHKLNMKAADIETIADKNIDFFYKENPATFMSRVEKYADQWEYAGDEDATERLMKKAELKLNKLESKSNIPKDLSTEVKIIYYTKGTDNQAKMLKSIAGDDKRMANRIIESLYEFGISEDKMIEIEDKYYQK